MKIFQVNRQTCHSMAKRQSGVTLLEVLIALAVLSIGLIGIAVMHLNSVKYVKAAYERSLASSIALDLEERLWLRLADTSSIGCPALATNSGAISELITQWQNGAVQAQGDKSLFPATIPGLTITVEGTRTFGTPGNAPAYAEVDLRLSWGSADEQRFTSEADTRMHFDYTARIFCSVDYSS
jgi:prepilin-type N-terminal cleavage/methylation domain-containing protein